MPIEQEACYLEWMPRLVVTSGVHQYFSAEADFTCPADAGGMGLEKIGVRAGSPESDLTLAFLAAFRFTPLRACWFRSPAQHSLHQGESKPQRKVAATWSYGLALPNTLPSRCVKQRGVSGAPLLRSKRVASSRRNPTFRPNATRLRLSGPTPLSGPRFGSAPGGGPVGGAGSGGVVGLGYLRIAARDNTGSPLALRWHSCGFSVSNPTFC